MCTNVGYHSSAKPPGSQLSSIFSLVWFIWFFLVELQPNISFIIDSCPGYFNQTQNKSNKKCLPSASESFGSNLKAFGRFSPQKVLLAFLTDWTESRGNSSFISFGSDPLKVPVNDRGEIFPNTETLNGMQPVAKCLEIKSQLISNTVQCEGPSMTQAAVTWSAIILLLERLCSSNPGSVIWPCRMLCMSCMLSSSSGSSVYTVYLWIGTVTAKLTWTW